MSEPRHLYTPSELNKEVRLHIEAGFPGLWIEGEITNLSRPASGHLYFSLKDDRAQLDCALFRSQVAALPFKPDNGMQVQAYGRISLYEARGRYQLIAERLEEAGEGRLRAAFDALKKRLEQEGMFDSSHKKELPAYPQRIAVITSPRGAVIQDIIQVLRRRWPLAAIRLYPVPVQGEDAAPAICRALSRANQHGWGEVLILGRGGGSLEDLWAFNDEAVARAVFQSEIPVVSAVGHETDFSISDFVADVRAATPSAAAELVSPDRAALLMSFKRIDRRMRKSLEFTQQQLAQRLDHLTHRLGRQHPSYRLEQFEDTLRQISLRLSGSVRRLIPEQQQSVRHVHERLVAAGRQMLERRGQRLGALAHTLHVVSPLPTLERGYAVLTDQPGGHTLRSVSAISPGQTIQAQLRDGTLKAQVTEVEENPPEPSG